MIIPENQPPADLAQLFAKIARITAAMKRVPKTGRNQYHKYDYATESDIVDAIRVAMGEAKLAIMPSVERIEQLPNDITRLHMNFIVACGDTGAVVLLPWIGDGQDKADKGVYKAYTGAEKYFLMKLFLVATGDDPEQDEPPPQRKAEITPQEARERFWKKYAPVLGAADWKIVQRLIDTSEDEPTTVSGWRQAALAIQAALAAEAEQAA
jgi:hypothetical protein